MIFYSEYVFVVGIILSIVVFTRKKQNEKKQKPVVPKATQATIAFCKIKPETYKGISFVRLSDLPKDQLQSIARSQIKRIKIKTDSSLLTDCVQYLDYEKWYESIRMSHTESERILE